MVFLYPVLLLRETGDKGLIPIIYFKKELVLSLNRYFYVIKVVLTMLLDLCFNESHYGVTVDRI